MKCTLPAGLRHDARYRYVSALVSPRLVTGMCTCVCTVPSWYPRTLVRYAGTCMFASLQWGRWPGARFPLPKTWGFLVLAVAASPARQSASGGGRGGTWSHTVFFTVAHVPPWPLPMGHARPCSWAGSSKQQSRRSSPAGYASKQQQCRPVQYLTHLIVQERNKESQVPANPGKPPLLVQDHLAYQTLHITDRSCTVQCLVLECSVPSSAT